MFKISLQKFIYILLLCTIFIPYVAAGFDDDAVLNEGKNPGDNSLGDNSVGDNNAEDENSNENNLADGDSDNAFDVNIEDNKEKEVKINSNDDNLRNMKMPLIDTTTEKVVQKIDIPKIIHQYVRSKENISDHSKENINSWKTKNPDWEHKLYDYNDIKEFMETYYTRLYDLWAALNYEEKIHMWKYAVLETVGGAYVNTNCICMKPLNQLLEKYDKSNILIGLDYLIIPQTILNNKKLTDSIQFNIRTIISAPGHEILTKMPFLIHRFRVLNTINAYEVDPDYKYYGRTFFSAGAALFAESVFDYLIENNVILENIVDGGIVKDVAILNKNAFSYETEELNNDLSNLPSDVYSFYYTEKSKIKSKNDYIL